MVQILKRAERLPNGRVRGVAPPRLEHRVVRVLSVSEQVEFQSIQMQEAEVKRKWRVFWNKIGLDPKRAYKFKPTGEVVDIGNPLPRY